MSSDKDNFKKMTSERSSRSNITKSDVVIGADDDSDDQTDFGSGAINSNYSGGFTQRST